MGRCLARPHVIDLRPEDVAAFHRMRKTSKSLTRKAVGSQGRGPPPLLRFFGQGLPENPKTYRFGAHYKEGFGDTGRGLGFGFNLGYRDLGSRV